MIEYSTGLSLLKSVSAGFRPQFESHKGWQGLRFPWPVSAKGVVSIIRHDCVGQTSSKRARKQPKEASQDNVDNCHHRCATVRFETMN